MKFVPLSARPAAIVAVSSLFLFFLLVQSGTAITVTVGDEEVNAIGATADVEIRLDSAPNGVAGYNISLALSNPGIAEITGVTYPAWATSNTTPLPANKVVIKGVDLNLKVEAGATNIVLATLTIRGDADGSTGIVATINSIDDDAGSKVVAAADNGLFVVDVPSPPNQAPVLASIGGKTVAEGSQLQFTASATDEDGDLLTFAATERPSGATFDPATRVFSWTPGYNQAGSHSVNITVTDGKLVDYEVVPITVTNTNRAPVLDGIGGKSVSEGSLLTFSISATDPDGGALTYAAIGVPSGASFDPSTKVFSWTPSSVQDGSYQVNFTVTDGSLTDFEIVTITVNDVAQNHAPVLAAIGSKSIAEGSQLQFTVSATDQDGDALTFAAIGLPSGAGFDPSTRIFTWTPGYDQAGSYQVNFTVTDGSLTDFEIVAITVGDVVTNSAPVLDPIGPKNVNEGQILQFTISATDQNAGDVLVFAALDKPAGASFDPATRTFSWTPGYTQAGSYQVNFTVSDGSLADFEVITITVANVNRAPDLEAIGNKAVDEGTFLQFTVSASDADGDALTYSVIDGPDGSQFAPASKTFSWTPGYDQAGSYQVNFTVTDGSLADYEVITITVRDVVPNDAPVLAFIGDQNVDEGELLTFAISATDPNPGDTLTFAAFDLPGGAGFVPATGTFSWTPGYDQAGSYEVNFTVSDGVFGDFEVVTITVHNMNRAPVLDAVGSRNVEEGSPLAFTLHATDPDGDAVALGVDPLPPGAVFDASTGVFSWTPSSGSAGQYEVNCTASDGSLVDYELVVVTVTADTGENSPPALDFIGAKDVAEGSLLEFAVSATDPDAGDLLTFAATDLPAGASFDPAAGRFAWTPGYDQAGSYTVNVTVTDGSFVDFELVPITVANTNRPPVLDPIGSKSTTVGTLVEFTVSATDPDGDALVYGAWKLPPNAKFNPTTRTFSWSPTPASIGRILIEFAVTDGTSLDAEPVIFTVAPGGTQKLDAGFTMDATSGSAPLTVHFTDASSGSPIRWLWQFGDGSFSNERNPSHTYQSPGKYTVRLWVSDGRRTDLEVQPRAITVTAPRLEAAFSADVQSGTAPLTVHFKDRSSGSIQFGIWNFGDGTFSFEKNPTHVYRRPGIYTVRLNVYGRGTMDTEVKHAYIKVSRR